MDQTTTPVQFFSALQTMVGAFVAICNDHARGKQTCILMGEWIGG